MNHPIALTLSAIIIAAVSMIVTPVIANHSGIHGYTKTSSGSLLYSTKVTAEKVNFYDWRRSSSSTAYYSFNYAAGSTYLMAAMKNGYGYVYDWNVSPPSTKDWFLSPRSYNDVKFLLVTDQNFRSDHPNHEADAYSLTLSAAEPWFKEEHGILLVKYVYKGNYTRTSTDCATIANEVKTIYGQPSGTEAILIVVGRNVDLKLNNESVLGCAIIPNVGGTYPWAIVKEVSNDPGRLSMHEISHLYGLQHVRDGLGNPLQDFKTVMHKYFDDPMSIKNWSPTEDNNLESRRGWY